MCKKFEKSCKRDTTAPIESGIVVKAAIVMNVVRTSPSGFTDVNNVGLRFVEVVD